jgi:hypothetical protein
MSFFVRKRKVARDVVLHIDSWNFHGNRFFVENTTGFMVYSGSLAVSFSAYALKMCQQQGSLRSQKNNQLWIL